MRCELSRLSSGGSRPPCWAASRGVGVRCGSPNRRRGDPPSPLGQANGGQDAPMSPNPTAPASLGDPLSTQAPKVREDHMGLWASETSGWCPRFLAGAPLVSWPPGISLTSGGEASLATPPSGPDGSRRRNSGQDRSSGVNWALKQTRGGPTGSGFRRSSSSRSLGASRRRPSGGKRETRPRKRLADA